MLSHASGASCILCPDVLKHVQWSQLHTAICLFTALRQAGSLRVSIIAAHSNLPCHREPESLLPSASWCPTPRTANPDKAISNLSRRSTYLLRKSVKHLEGALLLVQNTKEDLVEDHLAEPGCQIGPAGVIRTSPLPRRDPGLPRARSRTARRPSMARLREADSAPEACRTVLRDACE